MEIVLICGLLPVRRSSDACSSGQLIVVAFPLMQIRRFLVLPLYLPTFVSAADLAGRVVAVADGDTFTLGKLPSKQ